MKKRQRMLLAAGVVALLALVVVGLLFTADSTSATGGQTVSRERPAALTAAQTAPAPAGQAASATSVSVAKAAPTPSTLSPRGTKTVRVTADRTVTAQVRRAITETGARIIAPVGPRAVLVEATPAVSKRLAKDIRFTTEDVLPESKVQRLLAEKCAETDAATVPVTVIGLSAADRADLLKYVVAQGGTLCDGPSVPEILYAEIPTSLVASLAERGDVRWLEYNPPLHLFNDKSVVATAANVASVRTTHGLRGRGQTVAIYDSGFDTGDKDNCHLDFKGRVKEIVNEYQTKADYMGHGTHCAGTILGDGTRSGGQYKGAAPEAMLFAQGGGDTAGSTGIYLPGTFEHVFASCLGYDAYIHSDSWGNDSSGAYNSLCVGTDGVAWNHPELLIVVACGNAGYYGMGTVGSPAASKNVLTVGNCYSTRGNSPENLNVSSSRGPTQDYRIKPDITAPGTYINSTLSSKSLSCDPIPDNDYYTQMTGTSMATPLVSGSAALVRQWLIDRRDYTNGLPSASLVKAILTGGATMMTGNMTGSGSPTALPQEVPNNYTGWGRLNLEETLYPKNGRAVVYYDYVPFHDQVTESFDVTTTNAAPLDVQLCWTDYPADASADQAIVNDLDLIVSNKTTGAVWYGNGVEGGDHTNTVESVRIATAPAGEYAVLVVGHAVSYTSEDGGAAAVYIRGAFKDETQEDPLYVRNATQGKLYEFLDEALKAAHAGDTIEILKPAPLAKSVTLSVSCTIVATNANPLASAVACEEGAVITVAAGKTLTLTNVAFEAEHTDAIISVAAGGHLKLTGTTSVGRVTIADTGAIQLAVPLTFVGSYLGVDSPNGYATGDQIGTFTGDYLSASNAAALVTNVRDADLGGSCVEATGKLVWGVVPLSPANAGATLENEDGTVHYKTFARALVDALKKDSTLTVRKASEVTVLASVTNDLTLVGEGGYLTFTTNEASRAGGFEVGADGKLVISNLTVKGGDARLFDCAFKVTGGELRLEDGATLSGLVDADKYKYNTSWGGAVVVKSGTFTMLSGSAIKDCEAAGGRYGGGVWVGSTGATVNLFGGTISGCSASKGGAVYVWGNKSVGGTVNLKDDFTARDNKNKDGQSDNLFFAGKATLALEGDLTPTLTEASPTIGLTFGSSASYKNLEGSNFVTYVGTKVLEPASTAYHFFNDTDTELFGGVSSSETAFCWTRAAAGDGQCEESEANVFVLIPNTENVETYYHYKDLNIALAHVDWDATIRIKDGIRLTNTVTIAQSVRLEPYEADTTPVVYRSADAMYKVTGSLTVANVELWGYYDEDNNNSTVGLVSVDGGSLTLEEGAFVGHVDGYASRASNAITVFNGGTMTMKSGSQVAEVDNEYIDDYETSCGGGILLDHATGFFEGGLIYNCKAYRAGGLYVANGSTAYVSGDIFIGWNTAHKYDGEENTDDNVIVSKNSKLVLAGLLSCLDPDDDYGCIGVNEGFACDSNCFATVDWEWTDFEELQESAAQFVHDKRKLADPVYYPEWDYWDDTVYGTAVTNGEGKAILVWEDSVSTDGAYVDPSGKVYRNCSAAALSLAAAKQPFTTNLSSADDAMSLTLDCPDGAEGGYWYTVQSTEDLAKPFSVEKVIFVKPGESFSFDIDPDKSAKFYKVVAE